MGLLLVVDDDETVRESVAAILDSGGHQIILARDGQEAMQKYRARADQIDLVLMDVIMPKLDGIAAARAIRAAHPSARIILMSGCLEQVPPEADAFLPKPFRSRELFEAVQRVLAAPRRAPEAGRNPLPSEPVQDPG
jgi:CheY-like chemotaxis protein